MSRILNCLIRLCLLGIILLGPLRTLADDFPTRPDPPRLVNDLAHTMSADEASLLEARLVAFSNSTSNQVAIVTIKSLGAYTVEVYADNLFNRWGIGTKEHKNGILILASIEDHRIHIATGRGLEAALPDITAGQIIDEKMKPYFRENKYYQGFDAAATAIMAATRGEYKGNGDGGRRTRQNLAPILILIVIVIIIIGRRGGGGGGGRYMSGRGYGGFGGGFLGGSILGSALGGGGGSWGGGDSGGGGGFGGFGGGSTGGGGASGSW